MGFLGHSYSRFYLLWRWSTPIFSNVFIYKKTITTFETLSRLFLFFTFFFHNFVFVVFLVIDKIIASALSLIVYCCIVIVLFWNNAPKNDLYERKQSSLKINQLEVSIPWWPVKTFSLNLDLRATTWRD